MVKYVIKRLLYVVLIAILLTFIMYCIYNLVPGDEAAMLLQSQRSELIKIGQWEKVYAETRLKMGLDDNIVLRYLRWLGVAPLNGEFSGILEGDFGYSYYYRSDVISLIGTPMLNTVFINIFATILALGITIPLGIFCAIKKGSKFDTSVQVVTIVGYSLPVFIIAIVFIWLFAVILGWFPVSGMNTPGNTYSGFRAFLDQLYYYTLPLIVMTFCSLGGMTRYVRASMIDALSMDCIRTARAKGLRDKVVIYSHAWKNALIPIVTLVIGWFLGIFSGSLMIENIFSLNGISKLYFTSLMNQDFEIVLFLQVFYVSIGLLGNLFIDIVYGFIDPRIRVNK